MLATPKGVPTPPPQGQISVSIPAAALCRGKGKVSGSPGFAKPGADQRLDPPALLAVTAAPLAFGMIGDFPLRIAEEIPIPVSIQILTSSHVFQGGLPLFFGGFSPCVRLFRGGWDTYPTPERKAAHRGDSGFYCFSQWWCVLFQKCISSYKPVFPKCRNDFLGFLPVPQKKQNSIAVTLP